MTFRESSQRPQPIQPRLSAGHDTGAQRPPVPPSVHTVRSTHERPARAAPGERPPAFRTPVRRVHGGSRANTERLSKSPSRRVGEPVHRAASSRGRTNPGSLRVAGGDHDAGTSPAQEVLRWGRDRGHAVGRVDRRRSRRGDGRPQRQRLGHGQHRQHLPGHRQ